MDDMKRLDAEREWTKALQAMLAAAMERVTMLERLTEQAEFTLRLQQREEDEALREVLEHYKAPVEAHGEVLATAARVRWIGRQWDKEKDTLHEVNHALSFMFNGRPAMTVLQLQTGRFEARMDTGNAWIHESPVVARALCLVAAYTSMAASYSIDARASSLRLKALDEIAEVLDAAGVQPRPTIRERVALLAEACGGLLTQLAPVSRAGETAGQTLKRVLNERLERGHELGHIAKVLDGVQVGVALNTAARVGLLVREVEALRAVASSAQRQ